MPKPELISTSQGAYWVSTYFSLNEYNIRGTGYLRSNFNVLLRSGTYHIQQTIMQLQDRQQYRTRSFSTNVSGPMLGFRENQCWKVWVACVTVNQLQWWITNIRQCQLKIASKKISNVQNVPNNSHNLKYVSCCRSSFLVLMEEEVFARATMYKNL